MPYPKVIIFDVNETLLDLAPVKESVKQALGGRDELVALWFSTMLHYSLVETLSASYHSFEQIGIAALTMVAQKQGIEIGHDHAQAAVVPPLRSLPPHPDVVSGLKKLSGDGFRLVTLTNSSTEAAQAQLRNAGLTDLFEKSYSVELVKKFKPHPEPYNSVLEDLGIQAEDALMVAAHPWDLAGARNVGLQTAFIARAGAVLYPNSPKPDWIVQDLRELSTSLGHRA